MVRNREPNKKATTTSGITMIALVITIIILLILAAISVATLTGENGILTKAQQAKIETEKAAIEEQIRLAILSAKAKAMGGNITIQDVLEELDKAGVDYETEEGEDGTTITIDGNYEYEIKEENGDIGEPTYGGTVDKPKPRIRIEETNYEENTIEVKVSTKRNEQGSLEFYIKEEGKGDYEKTETIENAPEEYSYTFQVADKTKTYRIKVVALAKNGETAETEITVVGIPTLSSSNTTFTYTPTTATNKNVTATITIRNIHTADYALQYSIGNPDEESSWKDYTKAITLTQNGSVYARLKDKKKGQAGKYTKIGEIGNIDTTGPVFNEENPPTATATTNSITITGEATDEANEMGTYQYGIGVTTTDGTIKWTWEPENGTKDTTYTFEKLTQDTNYSVQMKATDSLGNETTSEIIKITTETVPTLKKEDIKWTYDPELNKNGKTNQTVTVTAEIVSEKLKNKGYQLYTSKTTGDESLEDESFKQQASQEFEDNGTMYLKLYDGTNYGEVLAFKVDVIDKVVPTFEVQPTASEETTHSIKVKGSAKEEGSGIETYQYGIAISKDKEEEMEWTWEPEKGTTETEHTFNKLTQKTDYSLQMKAVDKAGNEGKSEIFHKSTGEVPALTEKTIDETTGLYKGNTAFAFDPVGWSNTKITIRIVSEVEDEKNEYTLQYGTEVKGEDGKTIISWKNYPAEGKIEVTKNQTIHAKLIDETGQDAVNEQGEKVYASTNVEKIDNVEPNDFIMTASKELKDASASVKEKNGFKDVKLGANIVGGYNPWDYVYANRR